MPIDIETQSPTSNNTAAERHAPIGSTLLIFTYSQFLATTGLP
jgi:hypothetical protein